MMESITAEDREIVRLIRKLISRVYIQSKAMSKRFGVTGPQVLVLRTLLSHGPLPSATLAGLMYVTASNLTGIIDRLEAKKLLHRLPHAQDRRVTLIGLTDEGVHQAEKLHDPIEETVLASLESLPKEKVESIRLALEILVGGDELPAGLNDVDPDAQELDA